MSKSRVCVDKTVKLAKQNCAKKTNLLVYEKKPCSENKPKPRRTYVPPISSPKVKHIRICTGSELKRMCPPKPCDCPPKSHTTFLQHLKNLFALGLKGAIAFGFVYITVDLGVWGDSDRTESLYKDICNLLLQDDKSKKKKSLPPSCQAEKELFNTYKKDDCGCYKSLPVDYERSLYDFKQKWNKVVYVTFSSLAGFPYNFIHFVQSKIGSEEEEEEVEMECILEEVEEEEIEPEPDDGCESCD